MHIIYCVFTSDVTLDVDIVQPVPDPEVAHNL